MQYSFSFVLITLSILAFSLIGLNIFLLKILNGSEQIRNTKDLSHLNQARKKENILDLYLDKSKEYKLIPNFKISNRSSTKEDITLITHCTVNHLHHLIQLVNKWTGPVSVAVFISKEYSKFAFDLIDGLRNCVKNIRRRVTFHLLFPASHIPEQRSLNLLWSERGVIPKCDVFLSKKITLQEISQNYANIKVPYPNNLLRNIARKNSKTDFIFVVDIDMVCNNGLHETFLEFATRNKLFNNLHAGNNVYVVPAFEVKNNIIIPTDKAKLIGLWDDGLIEPFYYKICERCQKNTNYEKWKRLGLSNKLDVAYTVEWRDPWEPFYIAPSNVPLYDERFKQYGFNRISQVCETHVAGFDFQVLNNAFLVHQGFKRRNSFHVHKDAENERNKIIFRMLKVELKSKYPNSQRRCR